MQVILHYQLVMKNGYAQFCSVYEVNDENCFHMKINANKAKTKA